MCLLFNTLYDKITQLSIHNTYIGDKYMSILDAIILGIVQGVAEFLPISSSGHLAILHNLLICPTSAAITCSLTFCCTSARLSLSALCTGATLKQCLPRLSTCFPAERLTKTAGAGDFPRRGFYAYHCRDAALGTYSPGAQIH